MSEKKSMRTLSGENLIELIKIKMDQKGCSTTQKRTSVLN
jgi:hypothetical protein